MGGTIGVESVAGAGSTFWVELAAEAPSRGADRRDAPRAAADADVGADRRTVLYIEDNQAEPPLVQRDPPRGPASAPIVAMQAQPRASTSPASHRPDLILLDLHLPDMPGEEVLRRLRADPRTARHPGRDRQRRRHAGPDRAAARRGRRDYLTKPFDIDRLLALVDQYALR